MEKKNKARYRLVERWFKCSHKSRIDILPYITLYFVDPRYSNKTFGIYFGFLWFMCGLDFRKYDDEEWKWIKEKSVYYRCRKKAHK